MWKFKVPRKNVSRDPDHSYAVQRMNEFERIDFLPAESWIRVAVARLPVGCNKLDDSPADRG